MLEVTATLRNASIGHFPGTDVFVVQGFIYGDIRGRFRDGDMVKTSALVCMEGDLAITRNSVYKLEGFPTRESSDQEAISGG